MKFHTRRIRRLRRLVLAGCIVAAIAPASSSAMLPDRGPDRVVQQQQPAYTLPSGFRTEVQQQQQQAYTPPSGFRTEVQTSQPKPQPQTFHAIALRRGYQPSSAPTSVAPTSSPAVVHQIETVTDNSGRTLAIVLASIALAVALGSLCYASIRLAQLQRRELGSH
jgi:hypothetical protein